MRLQYGEAEEAFRAELIGWLEANLPPREVIRQPKRSSADLPDWARDWQRTLFDAGWLVPGWPPELGGRNATPVQQMIYFEEMSAREIPRSLNPQGLGIISPSLKDHGTPEQIEQFLLPTLRAEIAWCLGMSEPTAGSDLASLRTRAVLDGDHFVVNGQKVWTSGAHHADWCLCFVRTDPDLPKHKGISALIIDMKTPGVEPRPFPELSDPDFIDFNEVFFTDVEVPRANLLGEMNDGWRLTQGSLAHERAMLWIDYAYSLNRALRGAGGARRRARRRRPSPRRPRGVPRRGRERRDRRPGDRGARLPRLLEVHGRAGRRPNTRCSSCSGASRCSGRCRSATRPTASAASTPRDLGPPMWREGSWALQWMRSFGGTIPGGTSEIQRNIIAERVLGLPRV